mgnify:CR=1 FL=1
MKIRKTILALAATATVAGLGACSTESTQPVAPVASVGQYADVNGLHMYYEVHGAKTERPPLVLLHGALSGIGTDFGQLIPELSKTRQVIAIEQQAHGRTADIDRPLRTPQMADDTVALLRQLGVERADVLGYSMGAGVAIDVALKAPHLVHKLVLTSVALDAKGMHPGLIEGLAALEPSMLDGSEFQRDYLANAPRPQDFPQMVARVKDHDQNALPSWTPEQIRSITAPVMVVIGDSDIIRPEAAVELFRVVGGGIMGDTPAGLPNAQLLVVPGASHISVVHRPEVLLPAIPSFLDLPVK